MPGHNLKWIFKTATGQMVPGTGSADKQALTACYGFCVLGGVGTSTVTFSAGVSGALTRTLSICHAAASGADRDTLDGNGGMTEAENGVYVDVVGSPTAVGVLVDRSCREAP